MNNTCQNCNEDITLNFCNNCGQKKYKRIDKKYIWDEIQYTFFHTNKGFLYSVKKTLTNPGKTAKSFIEGNRVNHYKPILLAFVLSGISAFISFKIIGFANLLENYYSANNQNSNFMKEYMSFTTTYNSFIMLSLVPIFAVITTLAFRKWGQNYYEHIVMNAFGLSFYLLVLIIFFYPIIYLTKDNPDTFILISTTIPLAILPFVFVWFYKNFYSERSLKSIILKVLLLIFLILILYIIIIFSVIIFYILINGPENLQHINKK